MIEQNGLKKLSTMMKDHKEKILVVDDAPDNLRLLMSLLSQAYDVVEAEDGETALFMALNIFIPFLKSTSGTVFPTASRVSK